MLWGIFTLVSFTTSHIPCFKTLCCLLFLVLKLHCAGHTAEGTYNYTSTQQPECPDLTQVGNADELGNIEVRNQDLGDTLADHEQDDGDGRMQETKEEDVSAER